MKFLDVPQSGSIAGTTHSHNRAGQYTRNRRSPVQPVGSGRRATVRAFFAASSAGWSGLTNAQREAWNSFADSHPITDSLGSAVTLTGHQMYVRVTSTLLNVAKTVVTAPPTDLALPDLSTVAVSASVATGLSISNFLGIADSKVAVGVSKQFSPGRGFNKTFWQPPGDSGYFDGDAEPATISKAIYEAEFGTLVAGNRLFARITPVSTDGWNGPPAIVNCIVAA